MTDADSRPQLIAHRGAASRFPENSLIGIDAALQAGARHIEIDVQLSADGVPVVIHDEHLERITGQSGSVLRTDWQTLSNMPAGEPGRLGEAFSNTRLTTLKALVARWKNWPGATLWVEIKEESIWRFGIEQVMKRILPTLHPIVGRFIIISYDRRILQCIRSRYGAPIGWVLHGYDEVSRGIAAQLSPEFMICNVSKITAEGLWPGPWQWALYEFTDPELALQWHHRGAQFIETMAITELLQDPRWRRDYL